jgi:hypothetical protein
MMLAYAPPVHFGWGESLWVNKPTFEASLAALQELATRRLALLRPTIRIVTLRVTNPRLPRASRVHAFNEAGRYEGQSGTPWATLSLRFESGVCYANYPQGGVPGGMRRGLAGLPPGAWQQAFFDRYVEAVKEHCVLVNAKHRARGAEELQGTVINSIESIIVGLPERRWGLGQHYRPRGRRPSR